MPTGRRRASSHAACQAAAAPKDARTGGAAPGGPAPETLTVAGAVVAGAVVAGGVGSVVMGAGVSRAGEDVCGARYDAFSLSPWERAGVRGAQQPTGKTVPDGMGAKLSMLNGDVVWTT